MKTPIKILHLEDVETDADLVNRVIKRAGIEADIKVVDNKEAYVQALIEFHPDVILSDHTLPSFNSFEALNIFRQSGLKIPFILVTATMSEEYAVSIIKAGANDYILKDTLVKLPDAVLNSLEKIDTEIKLENQKALNVKEKTNAVLMAHENERRQMATALLENINQILAASNLYIDCAVSEADKRMIFIQNSKKYILLAIDEIKKLSQVVMPPILKEIGLTDSIDNWIRLQQKENSINFITDWKKFNDSVTSDKLQLTIYRIVQEQLNNAIKYSKATNVFIRLEQKDNLLELTIKDDGVGFDVLNNTKGVGLQNIDTRAEIHNGKMTLTSQPGDGCTLRVVFPL